MSKQASKRKYFPRVSVALVDFVLDFDTEIRAEHIAATAAFHALSGKAMSAAWVWRAMAPMCSIHYYDEDEPRCQSIKNNGGPCDMAHCPRLR